MNFGQFTTWASIRQLIRFYQAAIVNTAFGVGAYFVLVYLGMNIYLAQAISHFLGVCFNYFTYSRHVFREHAPAKLRFAVSYGVNYLVSLGVLALLVQFIASPYIAGLATALIVSLLNFFALKHLVFKPGVT